MLRRLAISDERFVGECGSEATRGQLDPKTLALVRLGALVAVGGGPPSYGAETDAAIHAGASATEIVEVLVGVVSVVGIPSVVAAAPSLAMALGYDVDDALEAHSCGDLGYSPSRPTPVACSTASLREETPSFR